MDEALKAVLEAAPQDKATAFTGLIRSVSREGSDRGLPSLFSDSEAQYGPEHVALRAEWYGPLRDDPGSLAMLRERASGASLADGASSRGGRPGGSGARGGFSFRGSTARMFLADAATPEDLRCLLDGFEGCGMVARTRIAWARNIGRAVAHLESNAGDSPMVVRALARLEKDLGHREAVAIAAALDGIARSGRRDRVEDTLEEMLLGEEDLVRDVLRQSAGLLRSLDEDSPARVRAIDWMRNELEKHSRGAGGSSLFGGSAPGASSFRDTVTFLADLDPGGCLDDLLTCYQDPERVRRLGMDGLQSLRIRLQRWRQSGAEGSERVDEFFWALLAETGARLFDLEEEPMTADEHQRFLDARDVRYNAASYFESLWDSTEAVRGVLEEDLEAGDYLGQLIAADADDVEGRGPDRLYWAVQDKEENLLLCARVLIRLERDVEGGEPAELEGLTELFLRVIAEEVGASTSEVLAGRASLGVYAGLRPSMAIEVVRDPPDPWLRDRAISGLRDLGYEVDRGDGRILVRFSD